MNTFIVLAGKVKEYKWNAIVLPTHTHLFRTARVGRSGLATSFYNERTSHLAPELAKLLKECKQEIPEFLQMYIPEDMYISLNEAKKKGMIQKRLT